ncbi:Gfo/Idh/MocA family protein [Paenibacillus yanchengensis]|uniref:Gfo/Idh/MocA family protein n=1 Tax=Paenibacillus yanchengensis TaxID=2035833 RepID=A0ABW4YHW2_9BACL
MTKTVQVAVIGCGQIAKTQHLPAYKNNSRSQLKYVYDIIPERAQAAAEQFAVAHVASSLEEVLQDGEVEAISICTPNASHAAIAIAALEAGKHVLCEKPAGMTYDEVIAMKQAADKYDRILNIGVVNRFNTAVNKIKQLLDAGELGNLYHIYCSFRAHRSIPGLGGPFTSKAHSGGGVLIDWGVHFIDLILYILGRDLQVNAVSGATYGELGKDLANYTYKSMWAGPPRLDGTFDVEDFVTALLRTNGPTINLNGAWAQNIGEQAMFVEFLGSKAGIKLMYGGEFTIYSSQHGMLYETASSFAQADMFAEEIDAFLQSLSSGSKNRANVDETLLTAQVIDAIYHSSATGKEVYL